MTNWKIEGFNLNDHLPEVEITVETYPETYGDDEVYEVVYKKKQLSGELTVILHENGQAALEFNENKQSFVEFMWSKEVAEAFNNIDTIKVVDLFELLHRNRIISRGDS